MKGIASVFHYLYETGYVQFQNRTKVVTHIMVRYKFLSNFCHISILFIEIISVTPSERY